MTKRYEFGEDKRWIGLHGVESAEGIEKLGIITMNPLCKPIGGEVQEIDKPEEPDEKVEPEEEEKQINPVEPEESNEATVAIVITIVIFILLVGAGFVFLYLRKRRMQQKLNQLDNNEDDENATLQKPDW